MITDYDLNNLDYQDIKRTNRDCKLSIGGGTGPTRHRRWVTYAQNTVWGHVFLSLSTKTPKEPFLIKKNLYIR